MANVTNHMLRKKLAEVNRESRFGVRGLSTATGSSNIQDKAELFVQEKKIVKLHGNTLIAEDDTEALLLNPLPSVKWKCNGVTNSEGIVSLEKPLSAIIIGDGQDNYVLGLDGDTDEFEIIIESGNTKLNINNTFISTQTDCIIENGVERKDE